MLIEKINLKDCSLEEIVNLCEKLKIEKFRARQIADWVYRKGVNSIDEMNNLSLALREQLSQEAIIHNLKVVAKPKSPKDGTTKYLWELGDGNTIETVLMPYEEKKRSKPRITVCVSTQVGCAMGCTFCATGIQGFIRNLTSGEIIDQVIQINKDLRKEAPEKSVTNVVIMGMGEPLLNYNNTLKAIKIFGSLFNISMRRITLSTCGIVPKIEALSREDLPIVLAISLHAPNNELRNSIMPVNRKYPLEILLETCKKYVQETGRRITFEYSLIDGINDSEIHARQLANLLKNLLCHVNLIPLNPVEESGYSRSRREKIASFKKTLEKAGIQVSVREEKGVEILAACGQLRQKEAKGGQWD